jgi:RimJ/RimL family protein N-acetyltransferase
MSVSQFPSEIELKSERLTLRTFRREDLDAENDWPDFEDLIYHHYNPPRDNSNSKDHRYLQSLRLFNTKLSIFDGENLVGYVGLYDTNFSSCESWMGIQFASNQRSRGYCKESLLCLCKEFFGKWEMNVMRLEVAAFNLPGVRCYESIGWLVTRQFWHPHAYQRHLDYENDSRLASITHHFRRVETGVEVDYLEMELSSHRFREIHND